MKDRDSQYSWVQDKKKTSEINDCEWSYVGNLTSHMMYEPPMISRENKIRFENLKFPCGYHDFVQIYSRKYVAQAFQDEFQKITDENELLRRYQLGERKVVFDYKVCVNESVENWFRHCILLIKEQQDIIAVSYIKDITEANIEEKNMKERIEKVQHANTEKTEFINRMSHDIRTPLNAILGMTQLASVNLEDSCRVKECLEKIMISSNHLLNLINEILDFEKMDSGILRINENPIDLIELVYHIADMLKEQSRCKDQKITVSLGQIRHKFVYVDELRFKELLVNVLGNAVKYTQEKGKIEVSLREKQSERPSYACYECIVLDNGIGMDEEFLPHIFDPFCRADNVSGKILGTGLGMSIARKIVRMMDGDIVVNSKLGKGSEFKISFWLKYAEIENVEERRHVQPWENEFAAAKDFFHKADFQGKHVLVVEDNALNLEIEAEILASTGADVDTAENGRQAVDKFRCSDLYFYDLVFMDIRMPELDGYQATKMIREMEREDAGKVPIIAMTANAFMDDEMMSRKVGMNDHVTKPLDIKKLLDTMEKWMSVK